MDTLGLAVRDETLPVGHELWQTLRADAARVAAEEETLTAFLEESVLSHACFADALLSLLVRKLACKVMTVERLSKPVATAMEADPDIVEAAAADLAAILARDPAADSCLTPFLYFKGYHALQWHRIGNWLWKQGRHDLAHFLQSRVSEAFAVDIHPAVPVGRGVFIDHGTGVVIGETAVIGNDVSILQNVTLGGTGKEHGDRHPKVKDGVLLAAGAKVLGNITLGARSKIGAGSVVLKDVPACATVAGIPAKIVGWCRDEAAPALTMDQSLQQGDYSI